MKAAAQILALALLLGTATAAAEQRPDFLDLLSGQPLDLSPLPGEVLTPEVLAFHRNGRNRYHGDSAAIESGRRLYMAECAFCHGRQGGGALGPPLTGPDWTYHTAETDVGMFSIIHGGAYGAMGAFARRGLHQDHMLRIIAYVRRLSGPGGALLSEAAARAGGNDATVQR